MIIVFLNHTVNGRCSLVSTSVKFVVDHVHGCGMRHETAFRPW